MRDETSLLLFDERSTVFNHHYVHGASTWGNCKQGFLKLSKDQKKIEMFVELIDFEFRNCKRLQANINFKGS